MRQTQACPSASIPWLCRMETHNLSWGMNNNPGCWQAIKVRKFSWFSNLEVIEFWLEALVVHFVPQFVLLSTEGSVWCWGGSRALVDPVPWGWAGHKQPKSFLALCAGSEHPQTGDKPQLQVNLWAGTCKSGRSHPKKGWKAPVDQGRFSLAETVRYWREDELWVIYAWLLSPGELIKAHSR